MSESELEEALATALHELQECRHQLEECINQRDSAMNALLNANKICNREKKEMMNDLLSDMNEQKQKYLKIIRDLQGKRSTSSSSPSPKPEKKKRCPKGTRRNKKTGNCDKYG